MNRKRSSDYKNYLSAAVLTVLTVLFSFGAFSIISYVVTQKPAKAKVIAKRNDHKVSLDLSYYNEYQKKFVQKSITVGYKVGNSINVGDTIDITYQKHLSGIHSKYNPAPGCGLLIFIIPLLLLCLYRLIYFISKIIY